MGLAKKPIFLLEVFPWNINLDIGAMKVETDTHRFLEGQASRAKCDEYVAVLEELKDRVLEWGELAKYLR